MPWNDPVYKNDPTEPFNDPMYKDDPTTPWNCPGSNQREYDEWKKDHNRW